MPEPDWDGKIEALDALHESLKSRLIEVQPSLPVEAPPVPCPPEPGGPSAESESTPSPSAPALSEAMEQPACVESRPPLSQEPVAPKIHDAGNALDPMAGGADSQDRRATIWPLVVLLACVGCVLVLIALTVLPLDRQGGEGERDERGEETEAVQLVAPAAPPEEWMLQFELGLDEGNEAGQDTVLPEPMDLTVPIPEDEPKKVGPAPTSESVERPAGTAAPSVVTIPAEWNRNWEPHIAYHKEEIRRHPTRASEYVALGIYRCKSGDTGEAIDNFTKALRIDSSSSRAYHNRGVARIIRGDVDLAIADFNNAVRLDPAYAAAYRNRGLAYRMMGELGLAEADFALAEQLERQRE